MMTRIIQKPAIALVAIGWLMLVSLPSFGMKHVASIESGSEEGEPTSGNVVASRLASEVMLQAMSLIGIAYRFGGNSPVTGFDCSGLIRYVFQKSVGMELPRTAAEQARSGRAVSLSELKTGDLVFFNTRGFPNSHSGIYLGNGKFIHAPRSGKSISVSDMATQYWVSRFNGARRLLKQP